MAKDSDRKEFVQMIDCLGLDQRFSPAEIADQIRGNRNTIKGYLDRYSETFPPVEKADNGYRLYSKDTLRRLLIFNSVRQRPARLTAGEAQSVFEKDLDALWRHYKLSDEDLFRFILDSKVLSTLS